MAPALSVRSGLSAVASIVVVAVAIMLYHTAVLPTYQLTANDISAKLKIVAPKAFESFDIKGATERLAAVVRVKTVSINPNEVVSGPGFLELHALFQRFYPQLHKHLKREIVNDYSLLYRWDGTNPTAKPYLLMSHMDVVPASNDTLADWSVEPFGGIIMNDDETGETYLYGRGSIDVKQGVTCVLEAIEWLLASTNGQWKPKRTVYLFFGHDEETGGNRGARAAMELLKDRGVRLDFVVDEGGMITQGVIDFTSRPVGMIGIGEKGYLTVTLEVHGGAGHSSMPPNPTSVGEIAAAVAALERNQMPATLRNVAPVLSFLAPELPFLSRLAVANTWLFESLLISQLSQTPTGNANLRTTTAPTMLSGSAKDNVLAQSATATINFRLLPGDDIPDVIQHIRTTVNNPRIKITPWLESGQNATTMSDPLAPQFRLLQDTMKQLFPDVLVAPYLVIGGTDARFFAPICDYIYRFIPYVTGPNDLTRYHGINERISVTDIKNVIQWFYQLIRNADES